MRDLAQQIWLRSGHPPPMEVRTLLEKAASSGDAQAHTLLGNLYFSGFAGLPRDEKEARRHWEIAAPNYPRAYASLGVSYASPQSGKPDDAVALKYYRLGADHGNKDSMTNLGRAYSEGRGVEIDYGAAYDWFLKAVAQNDLEARVEIAYLYDKGLGRPADRVQAYAWLLTADKVVKISNSRAQGYTDYVARLKFWLNDEQQAEAAERAKHLP